MSSIRSSDHSQDPFTLRVHDILSTNDQWPMASSTGIASSYLSSSKPLCCCLPTNNVVISSSSSNSIKMENAYRYLSLADIRQLHNSGTNLAAARGTCGRSVLHWAAYDGDLQRVEFLVNEAGVPITLPGTGARNLPIIDAVRQGNFDVMMFLLDRHVQARNGPAVEDLVREIRRILENPERIRMLAYDFDMFRHENMLQEEPEELARRNVEGALMYLQLMAAEGVAV